ncbi:hypothetical protein PsorP6_007869 [Peronosclerospora sorghi]|uniref:Uncharacterized protein n=1 Tax=Peronosclerospora sorghi TaxID=230839 RepID=A0ACC0W761_9STRA|nr:hypothetical protein PsorP6_007869 [Peronosclerospora sorghi]
MRLQSLANNKHWAVMSLKQALCEIPWTKLVSKVDRARQAKWVLRCYDSETAAHRGLSSAKLNLTNKQASLAITSSLTLDARPTPYMFVLSTNKHC